MSIDTETSPAPGNNAKPAVARRYAHDWALFADWCTACEHRALPTDPATLAAFLAEHPAAAGTQRRRVTAVNAVHTDHKYPVPGRSESIRQILNTTRAARLTRITATARERIPRIPVTGWPAGVFGRRDALILTLAATGLGFEHIARLRRDQLTLDAGTLVVASDGQRCEVPAASAGGMPAVATYRNWIEVLGFLDRYPSTRLLAQHLDRSADLSAVAGPARLDDRPLLTSIDRWGHTPLTPTPLTGPSVATLVRAHLSGHAPTHPRPPARPHPLPAPAPTEVPHVDTEWDAGSYDRGIHARRAALRHLEDITDILDDVEAEADRLLTDLLTLLDQTEDH